MRLEFSKVEVVPTFEGGADRYMNVRVDGRDFGECYRESEMDEWAPSPELRELLGEDVASGHAHAGQFKAALRQAAWNEASG